jgi:hypothetical protein
MKVFKFTFRPIYPRKITPVPIEHEVGRAIEPVWMFKEEKGLLFLPGFEPGTAQTVA